MTEFSGAVGALARALTKRGYETLTPVQETVLDVSLGERDLLVSAQTGSGKTVAFGLAIAPTLLRGEERFAPVADPLALIVAPTRELALQVRRELEWLYGETGAVLASCVGGMDIRTERRALERGAHIIVGTPGRLRDHISRGALDVGAMRAVVLDEADEMLDLGFREDLEFILEAMPDERRTLLFSATVPPLIVKLAKSFQRDAVRLETAGEARQHGDIEYRALICAPREQENAIVNVLRFYEAKNALVFCNTRAAVNHMMARLNNRGFSVVALSGELSQSERTHALQAMRDGRARVCIATDVAARGIDLPNLELVVHADLPTNPETLLHRSGRTGRAGRKGVSALMVDMRGRRKAERLLNFAKVTADWAAPPSADEVNSRDEERLLGDTVLSDPVTEDERRFVDRLMASFGGEQLSAAVLRLSRAGKSAPEDIEVIDVALPENRKPAGRFEKGERGERGSRNREEFSESVWFSLSVGRKQNAEPRWLIPMLCKNGKINKRSIGQIKMLTHETHVQLEAGVADKFIEQLGPGGVIEKNIRVSPLSGLPNPKEEHEAAPLKRKLSNADKERSGEKRGKPGKADRAQKLRGGKAKPEKVSKSGGPKPVKPGKKRAGKPAGGKAGGKPTRGKKT